MADIQFPWGAFEEAQRRKDQNQQNMVQNIAGLGQGLGQGLGSIGQAMQERKKKQIVDQLVQAIKTQGAPQQGPQMPTGPAIQGPPGYVPPGAGPSAVPAGQLPMPQNPQSGMGGPSQDNSQTMQALMMQYDPQSAMRMMPTPLQQSEIARNNALASRYNRITPPPGPGGPLTPQQDLRKQYIDAINRRTDIQGKSVNNRQTNLLLKGTNLPGQQLKTLTQNNMRADRALDLLSKPNVTWQALGYGITDLGAIMQGGVPHKEQILDAHFPSWKKKVAQYQTYATGQPTANVPEPIRQEVVRMIQSVKAIDNKFLEQNMNNQMDILGPTVQGFGKIKPIIQKGTQDFMGSEKTKYDPDKEARYQAWKKANGY